MTYRILQLNGLYYARLPDGVEIGPYLDVAALRRDMASIAEHLGKCFAGSK